MTGSSGKRVRNIAELARLAGVSPGTVSRALADKALVNLDTRRRIQALAAKHDFRPNQMASRLRTQRTGVIGVVVPLGHERRQHLSDPFFMTMIGHLADSLTENGYDLMLSRVVPNAADWLERIVDSGMLDGVLLIGQSDQYATIERVAAHYRPLVAWGVHRAGQRHCAVGTDNRAGGRLAGARLATQGVCRIAFLGEARGPEIEQRFEGVCDAAAASALDRPRLLEVPLAAEGMERAIAAHLDLLGDRIDGIVCASDVIAMTALRVLADRGVPVPATVKLVGYDDLPIAVQTVPRLTTVRQDIAVGARAMVDSLFARIGGVEAPSVVMTPTLVTRDTA